MFKKIADQWAGNGVLPEAEVTLWRLSFDHEELKPFGPVPGHKIHGYKNRKDAVHIYFDIFLDDSVFRRETHQLKGNEAQAFIELAQRKLEAYKQKEELEARKKAVLKAAGLDDETVDRRRKEVLKAADLE